MASSSFQNFTIADYLRILFQRIWVIILCTFIAVCVAGYFSIFKMKKKYKSSMDIKVGQKNSKNPFLKTLLTRASLNGVITDLRDKLQGEKRLRLLARNIRLKTKNEYVQMEYLKDYEKINLPDAVGRILKNLSESERIEIFSRMELVTLAKILGVFSLDEINPFAMNDVSSGLAQSEYLLDEQNEFFIKQLRKLLATKSELINKSYGLISIRQVRERAAAKVNAIVSDTKKFSKLQKIQLWEIYKELVSIDRLIDVGLYNINVKEARGYIGSLRSGLKVGITPNNFIHLLYDTSHSSLSEAIPHLVVLTAFEMIRAEYYASEEGHRIDAKAEMRKQIKRLSGEILEINKALANHKNLINLQLAYADNKEALLDDDKKIDVFIMPKVSTHVKKINELTDEKRKLEGEIKAKLASIAELEETLRNPSRIRIIQKTIKVENTPESRKLEVERNKKMEQLGRFRLDATEKHPMIQKLLQEIQQINLSLSGLNSPIETTVEKEHPMVSQWKAQRILHKEEIAVIKARIKEIDRNVKIEMKKAVEAPKRLQKYEALQKRKVTLTEMLNKSQDSLEKILAEENVGKGILWTEFEIYRSPVRPLKHYAPQVEVIIAIGFAIGLLAALGVIFVIEYTDHSIKGIEDAKRYFDIPILGTIPEFEFQHAESSYIKKSILIRKILGKGISSNSDGENIITTKKSRYLLGIIIFTLLLILAIGATFAYLNKEWVRSYYNEVKYMIVDNPNEKSKNEIVITNEISKEKPEVIKEKNSTPKKEIEGK